MKWKIFYSDDSTISSEDATPWSIVQRSEVQVIIQDSPDLGWITVCGDHYYVWDDRGSGPKWWGVDNFGLYDYLLKPGHRCVLFGISVDNSRFGAIFSRANKEIGEKYGFDRRERKP